jgi:hypothetical protein
MIDSETPAAARLLIEPGQIASSLYLRAAQAYMLISMPTGTSTIFGVFQVIRVSQLARRDDRAISRVGPPRSLRKGPGLCPFVRTPRTSAAGSGAEGPALRCGAKSLRDVHRALLLQQP